MKRKVISFKKEEETLLDHAQQFDFQNYVKKLIEYDMVHDVFSNDKRTIKEVYTEWMSKNVWKD